MQFLYQTVKEILGTGRVGVPVFVRCVVQVAPSGENIIDILAKMLTIAGSWLDAIPLRVYVQHNNESRQITGSIQYLGGQNAIVSINFTPKSIQRIDIMMLGNKGALYHNGENMFPEFDIAFLQLPVPEWLVDALERSLYDGGPVIIEEVVDLE